MTLAQALKVAKELMPVTNYKELEAHKTIENAINNNLCRLVQKTITVLEEETIGNQDLADSLTKILKGEQRGAKK